MMFCIPGKPSPLVPRPGKVICTGIILTWCVIRIPDGAAAPSVRSNPPFAEGSPDLQVVVQVSDNGVHHFEMAPVSSPGWVGDPLRWTIQAVDGNGITIGSLNDPASIVLQDENGPVPFESESELKFNRGRLQEHITVLRPALGARFGLQLDSGEVLWSNSFNVYPPPVRQTYQFPVADMVYDTNRNLLYAVVPYDADIHANELVAIRPPTGEIVGTMGLDLGSQESRSYNPPEMAISDDSAYLYVSIRNSNALAKINVETLEELETIPLSAESGYLEVIPGQSSSLVIGMGSSAAKIFYDGHFTDIRDNRTGIDLKYFQFGASFRDLFGIDAGWPGELLRVQIDLLMMGRLVRSAAIQIDPGFQFFGDMIYTTRGQIVNSTSLEVVGSLPVPPAPNNCGPLEVAPDKEEVYFIFPSGKADRLRIQCFDLESRIPMQFCNFPSMGVNGCLPAKELLLCSPDILALRGSDGNMALIQPPFLDPDLPPTDLALNTGSLPTEALCGQPLSFTLTATNTSGNRATEVTLSLRLPQQVAFVEARAGQGYCAATEGLLECRLGNLAPMTSLSTEITLLPEVCGLARLEANVIANEPDAVLANNRIELQFPVIRILQQNEQSRLDLAVNDMVYDLHSGQIYAALSRLTPEDLPGIQTIDPHRLRLEGLRSTAMEIDRLAISDDGTVLYGATTDRQHVVQLALPGLEPVRTIPIGSDPWGYPFHLDDMAVVPEHPDWLVVARSSARHLASLALLSAGTFQPATVESSIFRNEEICFGTDRTELFSYLGILDVLEGLRLRRCEVDAKGIHLLRDISKDLENPSALIYANGLLHTGQAIFGSPHGQFLANVKPLREKRKFIVNPYAHRVVSIEAGVAAFEFYFSDSLSGEQQGRLVLDELGLHPEPTSLVFWGMDGLAFNSGSEVIILRTSLMSMEPEADLQISTTGFPASANAGNILETQLVVTNAGPDPTENPRVVFMPSPWLELVDFQPETGSCQPTQYGLEWSLPPLAVGESARLSLRVLAVAAGREESTFVVQAATPDRNPHNNTVSLTTRIGFQLKPNSMAELGLDVNDLVWQPTEMRFLAATSSGVTAIDPPGVRVLLLRGFEFL